LETRGIAGAHMFVSDLLTLCVWALRKLGAVLQP
jgi:hypothetical protein